MREPVHFTILAQCLALPLAVQTTVLSGKWPLTEFLQTVNKEEDCD